MAGAIIVGIGPGIGTSVARKFGTAGMPVGLIARSGATIEADAATLAAARITAVSAIADAAGEDQLTSALDALVAQLGVPEIFIYNAGLIQNQMDRPGELSRERHLAAYAVNVLGALTAATHLAPAMAGAGGTILITGGMPEPLPEVTSLSLGKAGVRALTMLLAREYEPWGIHVATVTVGGAVAPGGPFDPDRIAELYWRLYTQPRAAWEHEVLFTGEPANIEGGLL
jgi:NAD(P)-dependent dehydrogenase (short-subunit alcohol dehydrogenase family)